MNRISSLAPLRLFATIVLMIACAVGAAPASAQGLDISGWTLEQANSGMVYTFGAGTVVPDGGYVIVGRNATRTAFESYYGVSLGSNVLYYSLQVASPAMPMINGDETYTVKNAGAGVEDGPTPGITATKVAYNRTDPEVLAWSGGTTATPGAGVETPDAIHSGLVISEANDADDYNYEYIELYNDSVGGAGNQQPAISSVFHSPSDPVAGDDLTVSATIVDPDGSIVDAELWYRIGGSGSYVSAAMTDGGGDLWQVSILDLAGNYLVEYYVSAEDDAGAIVEDPFDAPTTVYSVWVQGSVSAGKVVLFDHAHDQDAGTSGNWRIDDNYPDPLPASPSAETDWSGQLWEWGYELYLAGHNLRSTNSALSASVLAGVDMLVIPEPQNPFTAAEIEAVRQFVYDGGSLFMIGDHNSSDRNGNGWDSPSIFGGYTYPHISEPVGDDVETFAGAIFGLHYHVKDEGNNGITGTFTNVNSDPANPIIHGSYGDVSAVIYHVGNVMSLWPTANPDLSDVGGLIAKDEGSPYVAAWSRYGAGKVVGYGDSSSMADGTGSESHEDNWTEAGSNNREFFLNASMWLLADNPTGVGDAPALPGLDLRASPNPFNPRTVISFVMPAAGVANVEVFDMRGRVVRSLLSAEREAGPQSVVWDGRGSDGRTVPSGVYLVRASGGRMVSFTKVSLTK